ncbi:MAG: hypothetical protein AAGI15_17125 [Pseudomonadota bacterium]
MNTVAQDRQVSGRTAATGLSGWLRLGGLLAMLAAVASFLLQGVEHELAALRDWFGIGALLACVGGGWVCHRLLADRYGVRLLFALALLIVPAQFAHLGSLLVDLYQTVPGDALALAGLPSAGSWGGQLLCSLLLGALVAHAGFRVLAPARPRSVLYGWLLLNVLLLIPLREGLGGWLVPLMALAVTAFAGTAAAPGATAPAAMLERVGLRVALVLPALIASLRAVLFQDPAGAIPMLLAFCGFAALLVSRWPGTARPLAAATAATGSAFLSLSWLSLNLLQWVTGTVLAGLPETVQALVALLPLLLLTHWQSQPEMPGAGATRLLYALKAGLLAAALLGQTSLSAALALLLIGVTLGLADLWQGAGRRPLVGALMALAGLAQTLWLALAGYEAAGWLLLGAVGLSLVLGAGALERIGSAVKPSGQTAPGWPAAGTADQSLR